MVFDMALTPQREAELKTLCNRFRIDVLTAIHGAQSGHPGGSLSVCEILTLLYQQRMRVSAAAPADPDRDRLVLSKGHAAPMCYPATWFITAVVFILYYRRSNWLERCITLSGEGQ